VQLQGEEEIVNSVGFYEAEGGVGFDEAEGGLVLNEGGKRDDDDGESEPDFCPQLLWVGRI